ncbi:MAG: RidA family protein [SAR202 cluster bacterium]|nr:RidA family protein [SAR202 cluster bacterium]
MAIQRLDPHTMVKMPGLHQTVKVGNTVYIAGQVALDEAGTFHGDGDVEAQLNQIYDNLENACRAYGGTLSSMVKTTTYITDPAHFSAVSKIRQKKYGESAPVNATLIVAGLAKSEWWVEIEGTAWVE